MKKNLEKLLVYKGYTIRQVLEVLDAGAKGIVLFVDQDRKLIGTITDGDIRRAILKGIALDQDIEGVAHRRPIAASTTMTREELKDLFIKEAIRDLPIVDKDNVIIDLLSINDILLPQGKDNIVIIMAGGLGTRLMDLTKEIPKPMLKVGQDPMLQHIINHFKQYGYNKILISVNYKSEIIENYFQDGYAYGVKIEYLKEYKRLGTAGGIKIAKGYLDKPFFVINADIFTNVNIENMMNFHLENKFDFTVGTRKYTMQVPYGVIETEGNRIQNLVEKPTLEHLINAGIYCINPGVVDLIPDNEYFEITDLINLCIKNNRKVGSCEINGYWMDIGKIEDYRKINEDLEQLISSEEG